MMKTTFSKINGSGRQMKFACMLAFMLLATTLSFAQTNSLTLGCPTASGNSYQYAALSLTAGDGVVRSISISFSENPDGCSINLPSTSWTVSGNEYSRYIIPAEGATSAQIEAFLQGVTFNVPSGTLKGVNIILSIDDASRQIFYFAGNGHYYEYVPYDGTKTWTIAYNEAKGKEYCGRPGYLATLTTAEEDAFVTRIVQNAMWIGGTRLSPTDDATSTGTQYYANFDTGDQSSPESTDYWYWACGPEKGARITNEGAITNSADDLDWYAAQPREPNEYTNWMYAVGILTGSMHSAEPNNSGYESCLTVLRLELHEGYIYTRKSENESTRIGDYVFGWNDVTYEGNNTSSKWRPKGYLVEYGDQPIGHSQTDEACSISASGLVGNATRTVKATLSGDTAVCAEGTATLNITFEGGAYPFTGTVQGDGVTVHTFNTNDISYNFTVTPNETTAYTISAFSDASSTGEDGCEVYTINYTPSGSATVTVNNPQVTLNDFDPVAICAGASTTLTATTETATGDVTYAWSPAAGLSATTGASVTANPTSTTTYTVTATATQGGCTATATKSVTVTVHTPQVALKNITPVAICAGASTTLTAELDGTSTGDISYAWSTGATENEITVTPSATTTYTVTATATQGECTATATKSVTVTVNELPTATVSVTDVKCNGAGDGIITVNANGGSGSYQYQLGTGTFQPSNIFAELAAGDYTLTVKDGNSCTTTTTATIDEPTQLTLTSVSATDETCNENNDGTISYTVGGGTLNYTITFAEGISATQSAAGTYTQSNLLAGGYVVKVVDQNGCSVTAPAVTIKEPATLEINQVGNIIPAQCKGDSNGQFAFSIAGGNGTNTITIAGPAGNVAVASPVSGVYTQEGLSAGTYTVSVTDNKGCSATKSFDVGEPGAVLSATVTSTQESCTGNDGTATVAATGGNGGYSFLWSNGQNSATATGLSSFTNGGVYTVTVSDAKGCTNVQNDTITLNNPLAMAPITGPAVCTGTEFSITPADGTNGTIPAGTTYSWPAPSAISGIGGLAAGTDRSSINGVLTNSNSTPQTVSYTVTPKNGVCVGNAVGVTVTVTTTVNPNVTIDMPNTMTVCSNADDFSLSATFVNSVSNSTVVWKKDGTTMATHTVTGNTDSYTIDLNNDICKEEYTYRVEYTDVSGCTASDECVITVNAGDWSITQPAGTATVECVSAATEPAVSLLPVVNDGCGRTTTRTLHSVVKTPSDISCEGTVVYTYRYTSCDETFNDWTYTYTINDVTNPTVAADAITTKVADIDQTACKFSIPDLTADIRAKATDNCTEAADLVITQAPAADTEITAATNVVVTVTDKCGNSTTHTVNVTVPTLPTATIAPTHILCHGNTTGSATVTPANGTAPYTYLWSNSQTVATATELDNREYTVTVTDANRCSTTASVTITEPEALSATPATIPVDCYGNSTGSATITVTGGTPSYSVTVNGVTKSGNGELTFENLPDGTYPVTIKDANNCELTGVSVTITEPEVLAISANLTQVKCKDGNNGAIDLTVTGGNGSYQYVWNNGKTDQDLTGLTAGEYNVTVKDAKNCSISGTYTITEPALLQISSITPTNITCPSGEDGEIEVAVTGGTTPYSYQLNGGDAQSSAIFETLTAGSYTVTVTDANGCSTTSSTTLTQPAPLTLMGCSMNILRTTDDGKNYATVIWPEPTFSPIGNGATLNVTGKTATNQYPVGTTTITYTVTNTCGESKSCSFTINVQDNQAPKITCAVTGDQDVLPNSAGNTYTHSGNSWNATATDNVAVVSLTYTLTGATVDNTPKTTLDGQVFNYGTTTVTWKATDNTGASDVCSFQVVVADNTVPVLTCPTITTVYECLAEVPATYANYAAFTAAGGTATDNHQINESSFAVTETVVTGCPTTITRTYSIEDMTGNVGTCSQVITVEDKTAPALKSGSTLPAGESNMSLCYDSIPAGPTEADIEALYEDNCGGEVIVSKSGTPTGDDCGWNVTYTYVIKDTCNNTTTATVSYSGKAADFTMPENGSKTVACASAIEAPELPTVTDNCGNALTGVLKSGYPTATPACEGDVVYVYTFTDCAGHTHDWTYTYTIDRTTAPNEVGGPVTTASTVECASAATAPTTLPVVKDVCGNVIPVPTPVEGGTYTDCEGTKTYTYTYKDCANLEYVWTYTYTIDRTTAPAQEGGPVATSSTVECASAATAPTTLPVVEDVCGNVIPAPTPVVGGTYTDCEGTKTYTYTYKDCANLEYVWTYTYTIDRTTAPAQEGGPVAIASTVECVADATAPTTLPVVKDVCGNVISAPEPVEGGTYTDCEGTKTYTYTYKDCANLEYVWTYTYTIDRTTAPNEVGGPVATSSTVQCASAATAPTTLPVVKDVCGNTLAAPTPVVGGTYTDCEGTKTYTYTYEDCAGLQYVWTYTYTIDRTTAPAEVGGPVTTASTVECASAATAPTALPVVKDVCGNVIPAPEPVEGGTYTDCEGTKTYTYTYKDCANLEYVWTYTYTIDRTTAPAQEGGPVATSSTVECVADATAPTTLPVVKDVCGNVIPAPTPVEGGTYTDCEGTKTYTYTYKDCANLEYVWTYTYTIDRTTAPAQEGGPVATSSTVECVADATAPATLPVVKDVCGNTIAAPEAVVTDNPSSLTCEGTRTYTYTYKDCAGLQYVWTYTYTIDRTTAPAEVGGPVTTASTVECASAATAPTTLPVVKDVCGNVIPAPTPVEGGTYTDCEGTKTYTYTYKDCANLEYVWTYTYTIDRTTAPAQEGGPVATSSTVECVADATAPATLPVVKDVCGNTLAAPEAVVTDNPSSLTCEGTRTYTYTYKDCANLEYVWTYTYTIDRTTAPSEVDGPVATASTVGCIADATAPTTLPVVKDVCGNTLTDPTLVEGGTYTDCAGTKTYTYTYEDCSGLQYVWTYTYTIEHPTLTFTGSITDVENVDACYSESHKSQLLTAEQVKAMYTSSCSREITVSTNDVVVRNSDCDWKITRTYSISDGGCNTDSQTMSISGGDKTAPTIGTDDLDRTLTSTNCVFKIPDFTTEVRNISNDLCTPNADLIISQSPAAGTVLAQTDAAQNVTVTVTVMDLCDNASTKDVVVIVPAKVTVTATADPATICYGATSQLTATPSNVVGTPTYTWTPSAGLNDATIANPVATLTTTTTYTVEVTDENGCTATATATVNVNPEVVMDAVSPMTLCVGDVTSYDFTTPLTVGTMNYAWTNTNTAIGLAASGNGNLPSFTPTNTTNAPINATIAVTPSHTYNGITCVGDPINFTITVRPSILTEGNVEFTCPADTTVVLSYSDCEQYVNIGSPDFVNNMSDMNVTITNDAPAGNIFPEGVTIVTWTATDECGEFLTCTQSVEIQFPPCGDPIVDFDGYSYSTVRIGCQCWTGENVRSEHYSDGTPVSDFRAYNDSDSLENIYGKLYSWYSAARVAEGDNAATPVDSVDQLGNPYVQGICPEGWALPTVEEYMMMIAISNGAHHVKDGSSLHWLPGFEGQTPLSGFDALGAGVYDSTLDRFEDLLGRTNFWTTINNGGEVSSSVEISYYCSEGLIIDHKKADALSVRCIRKK